MSEGVQTYDPNEIVTEFIPPSQNACYRNLNVPGLKGRAKTQAYKTWLNAFGWDAKAQVGSKTIQGPYSITIVIDRRSRHRLSDIMNREKPVSDALQSLGIIKDDNLCERGTVCWGDLATKGMRIEIWPVQV